MPRVKRNVGFKGDVKDALLRSFHRGGADRWLLKLMMEEPKAYAALLGKCIPLEVAATINHALVDLGAAMIEAQRRVDQPLIDVTPNQTNDRLQIPTLADLSD